MTRSITMYAVIGGRVHHHALRRRSGTTRSWRYARLGVATMADGQTRLQVNAAAAAAAAAASTTSMSHIRHASSLGKRPGGGEQSSRKGEGQCSDENRDGSDVPTVQQTNGTTPATASDLAAAQRRPIRMTTSRLEQLRNSTNGRASLTLEHFLLRDKGVKLWRDFLRATRNIANPAARRETIDWLRDEHFEGPSGLRHLTDTSRIRDALMNGNVTLKRICGPMELASALNPVAGAFPKLVGRRALS